MPSAERLRDEYLNVSLSLPTWENDPSISSTENKYITETKPPTSGGMRELLVPLPKVVQTGLLATSLIFFSGMTEHLNTETATSFGKRKSSETKRAYDHCRDKVIQTEHPPYEIVEFSTRDEIKRCMSDLV